MVKNRPANVGDVTHAGLIPVGKITWGKAGPPTPVPCLENPRDRGAWWATVRGVKKSRT